MKSLAILLFVTFSSNFSAHGKSCADLFVERRPIEKLYHTIPHATGIYDRMQEVGQIATSTNSNAGAIHQYVLKPNRRGAAIGGFEETTLACRNCDLAAWYFELSIWR